ncbi:MAG: response regulator [Anaerolineae bacterium]
MIMTTNADAALLILLVDDEDNMRDTMADILEAHAYEVDQAADGMQALRQVVQNSYGLVLMDIRMPVMDGVAALREIRAIRPDLPVILMTAYAESVAEQEAARLGAEAILHKPLDMHALLEHIESLLKDK